MTAQERITEWAELAGAASPGPWNYGTLPDEMGKKEDTGTYLTAFAHRPKAPCTDVWVVWTPSDTGVIAPAITGDGPTSGPNAAYIAASRTAVPAMAAALTAVLERHHRRVWSILSGDSATFAQTEYLDQCDHCRRAYPCPTVAAIETALGVTA